MTDEEQARLEQQNRWRKLAADQEGTLLFETAGDTHAGASYLFVNPVRCLVANDERSLWELFLELAAAREAGFYAAGLLRYEAGYTFERIRNRQPVQEPLAWFGIYQKPEIALRALPPAATPPPQSLCVSMATPLPEYLRQVAAIQRYIEAGDSYQVNLTTAMRSSYAGGALELYNALAEQQPAPFSALLHLPENEFVLSFSPELFFSINPDRTITMRPMKGTAPLGARPEGDQKQMVWLAADEKNRAEHLMIVDLLRSDLGRLCTPGSIRVQPLFAIERYRTLLQMTSTVTGSLRPATSLLEVFRALFPSGSMTGAPKPRTMEILAELESGSRGVYSGAIGFAAPDGTSVFNVAIRTVTLKDGCLRMGVGGGVVADSVARQEHAECWLKSEFLLRASSPFALVETLLWEGNFPFLEQHLGRLEASAEQLNFPLQVNAVKQQLLGFAAELTARCRVRLELQRSGNVTLTTGEARCWPKSLHLRLSSQPSWSNDSFLRHKTTFRPLYEREYIKAQGDGFEEVIFTNERQELTEGSISNLLLLINGVWHTPELGSGVLPGVARSRLLESGHIRESALSIAELERAEAVAVCNAVRAVGSVTSVQLRDGRLLRFNTTSALPGLR